MSTPDPRMRVSDSDRERAMADLAEHYAEGRLEHEEYDERLDAIWTARTRADLAVLFGDLPRPAAARPAGPPARAPHPRGRGRARMPVLPVLALLIVLSVLTGAPLWVLIFPLWIFAGRRGGCAPGRGHHGPQRSTGW